MKAYSFLLLLAVCSSSRATDVGGTISNNVTWTLAGSPYVATNSVAVTNNVTLTIEPGVTVQFTNGTGMTIRGRLLAEGNSGNRIRFTRHPNGTSWTRLDFTANSLESRITFADIEYATSAGNVRGTGTSLYLESVVFTNTTVQLLNLTDTSITLLNSVLPTINGAELVHGTGLPASGHAIIKGNVFGSTTTGLNDVIDFTGGQRPGAILQLYDNVFLGGSDDGLDFDGTDAHIEGNIFLHFHAGQGPGAADTSSAISGGQDSGHTSRLTIARNLFYDCDHGVLCKETNFYVIQNNTFVNMLQGVVNFNEPLRSGVTPGAGIIFEGNIVWNSQTNFQNVTTNALAINRNILSGLDHTNGPGNLFTDPLLVGTNGVTADNIRALFALQAGSPALGAGPNGLDIGALVPAGASISGEPPATTTNDSAALKVAGAGISAYQWRLNNGAWSSVVPLTNSFNFSTNLFAGAVPITLSNLAPGNTYTVQVVGINSAGLVQDTNFPTVSKTWSIPATNLNVGGTLTSNTVWTAALPIHVTNTVTVPTNLTLTIQAGALVRIRTNASLITQAGGTIDVEGTAASPVLFRSLNGASNWNRIGASGTNASLVLRHADVEHGQVSVTNFAGGLFENCYFHDYHVTAAGTIYNQPIMVTERASSLLVRACRFQNYYETLFRLGVIVIEDSLFENVTGDAVDFDTAAAGSVIRRSTFRHGAAVNVDAVDLGSQSEGVTVENCLMYDFPFDKGVSIGERSSNITVRACVIYDVDIGVAVKDSSVADIVNNTIADSNNGLSLYEKIAGQGGGHAVAWNNILWDNTNSVVLDVLSTITVNYSDVSGATLYPGTSNLLADPLFLNAPLRDYRLAANSPAIGAGTNGTTMGALFPVGSHLVDTDNDGLPDTWEQTYGLNFNSTADAALDNDGDGFTNLQEFWAGTNPTNSASALRIDAAAQNNNLLLSFDAISNRSYSIEFRTALDNGGWTNLIDVSSAPTNRTITVTNATSPDAVRFFRLIARPQ